MTKDKSDKNNIEKQKVYDLVSNTITCLFITGKADTFADQIKFNFNF